MISGTIGFLLGILVGGYVGLIIGGTFLGSFDIYERIGIEGYELTAYIGVIVGILIGTGLGIRFAWRSNKEIKKK